MGGIELPQPPAPPPAPAHQAEHLDLGKLTADQLGRLCVQAQAQHQGERPRLEFWLLGQHKRRVRVRGTCTAKVLVQHEGEAFVRVWVDELWRQLVRNHPNEMDALRQAAQRLSQELPAGSSGRFA